MNRIAPYRVAYLIAHEAMVETGLTFAVLMQRTRMPGDVEGRELIAWMLRHRTSLSYPEIARLMGKRSHSTVVSQVARFRARLAAGDAEAERLVRAVDARMKALSEAPAIPPRESAARIGTTEAA